MKIIYVYPYNVQCVYLHVTYMYIHVRIYIRNSEAIAKQGGGVNWSDLGQVDHHPLYIFQLQDHPHPLPAPGGCCLCVRGIFDACLKTSLLKTVIIELSISHIDPVVFLLIELSIYRLSNQLTLKNYRFIDIDPRN